MYVEMFLKAAQNCPQGTLQLMLLYFKQHDLHIPAVDSG